MHSVDNDFETSTQEHPVKDYLDLNLSLSLKFIQETKGINGLHQHQGPFIYEHIPGNGNILTEVQKAIRNKVLYTLVTEMLAE